MVLDARRVFIVAEAGVNHDGDLETALGLVRAAADAGADAVKFQTFRADLVCAPAAPKAAYQEARTPPAETQTQMLRRLELPWSWHHLLRDEARSRGIEFLSTAFDPESVDFLVSLGVPALKIPSGEVTNPRLLERIAAHRLPVLCSTGMCSMEEVAWVVEFLRVRGVGTGGTPLVLLHCVTSYPAPLGEVNLRALSTLAKAFDLPVGYSDHTEGIEVAVAAVALGARVIEKHLTLDRRRAGPDHAASLNPDEFGSMVRSVRRVESALGDGRKAPAPSEIPMREIVRRSLATSRSLPRGRVLERNDLIALRPGGGIDPRRETEIVGRALACDLPPGTILLDEHLS